MFWNTEFKIGNEQKDTWFWRGGDSRQKTQ